MRDNQWKRLKDIFLKVEASKTSAIESMYNEGYSIADIAKEVELREETIRYILRLDVD